MNVLIYFTEERRRNLVQRFYDSLEPVAICFSAIPNPFPKCPSSFKPSS